MVVLYLFQRDAQRVAEEGLAGEEAVAGLLEVVGVGVVVDGVVDLVHAGQGVEDLHGGLGLGQHGELEEVAVLDALVLHEVGEALLLHAGHVEDVGPGDEVLVEVGVLHVAHAVLAAVPLPVLGHGELFGGDEVEGGGEVPHGREHGVDGAAVFEVAHEVDVEVVQRALGLVDGVEVEHGLRGVLVGPVSGVHDGHGGDLRGVAGGALEVVAHDDEVCVVGYHDDGVFQRLALGAAGDLRVGEADDARPEAVGRRLE